ncbi:MAG TPA: OsmC family protein [Polyangiaceae bacterium]|jgi:ribosomal protein S12 methylthiotransferase accessory factor|nr:OsmC family protein [Polyangiaceae bacterium]
MDLHETRVTFPEGKRVDAAFGAHVVRTDQSPAHGGAGAAPEPFELFLASLATCAGIYALAFCQARGLSTEGLDLMQRATFDPETKRLARVDLVVTLPPGFPEKYRAPIVRSMEGCRVKKTLLDPPVVTVTASEGATLAPAIASAQPA